MRNWLICLVFVVACGSQPTRPAVFVVHGFEPWSSEYRNGAEPMLLHALLAFEGDRERLAQAGAKIGSLYSPEGPTERLAYTAASYGATHMVRLEVVEHSDVVNTSAWTSCYESFGYVNCNSFGGPRVVKSFTHSYELYRVERASWAALPASMAPADRAWVPPPEAWPPKPPDGCEYVNRDVFGRYDSRKVWQRCGDGKYTELDPSTYKPLGS